MILGEDLTTGEPAQRGLSQAEVPGPTWGFAYYESSLVVRMAHRSTWGLEKVKALLGDLARGVEINTALAAHFALPSPNSMRTSPPTLPSSQRTPALKLDWTTRARPGGLRQRQGGSAISSRRTRIISPP
ncbi:MAG: hypothetical protein WDN28_07345 [Chthoniobacter sp.]